MPISRQFAERIAWRKLTHPFIHSAFHPRTIRRQGRGLLRAGRAVADSNTENQICVEMEGAQKSCATSS
jgi:hypothetical protein